jgi:signal transduction histidine kinase
MPGVMWCSLTDSLRRAAFHALLWCMAGIGPAAAAEAPTITVRTALSAPGSGTAFPADAPALGVTLPDHWDRSRPGFEGALWYRVDFQAPVAPAGDEVLGLAIEHACSSLDVFLNGQRIVAAGRADAPFTPGCDHARLIPLPSALLRAGTNTLDIRVTGLRREQVGSRWRAGSLSALRIGPWAALEPWHARHQALAIDAPRAAGAMLLLLGAFSFALGLRRRSDSPLAHFGALAVGVALIGTYPWPGPLALGPLGSEFVRLMLLGLVGWAGVQFLLRLAGVRLMLADAGLPLQCAAIALSLLVAGGGRLATVAWFWHVVLALEVAAAALVLLRQRWATPMGVWIALALAAVALATGVAWTTQWNEARPLATHLAALVLPLVLTLWGLHQLLQHGRLLQRAEPGQQQLEQRIREATAEIERNFRQLAELKVEQVTERERKRIAADLHDDLGAKLLTIVHTSESERISTLAREALEEMRLSVRGLTGKPVHLADAMGDWRAETVARLAQAGIEGEWNAPEDLAHRLSSRAYVQTTRILREATSNIIKHSNATHCAVVCAIAEGDFQLVIQDNGEGISSEVDERLDRGHGLAGMKNRAKALHGQCLVESGPGYGTVIRLTLPLDRAVGPS